MSTWRQKAIEIAPELKKDFQAPDLSPYSVFSEFLSLLEQAHIDNDLIKIKSIYDYAEWCSQQKDQKLWNSAGVSFYEHLSDSELVFSQFTKWVKKSIYVEHRDLLNHRFDDDKMKQLDKFYGLTTTKSQGTVIATTAYMGFVLWWADEQRLIFNFSIGHLVMG
jgi:hypothetical protein